MKPKRLSESVSIHQVVCGILTTLLVFFAPRAKALEVSNVEKLAIQDGGRVKPFDTFATESVQLITGSSKFRGKNSTEIVLSWLLLPDQWADQSIFQVKNLTLKSELGLLPDQNFAKLKDIIHNTKLPSLFTELGQLQKEKKKLDPYHSAILRLDNQLALYQDIVTGHGLKFVPQKLSQDWLAINELKGELQDGFARLAQSYFIAIAKGDQSGFDTAVAHFKDLARSENLKAYPTEGELKWEIIYNKTHPFRVAYLIYLFAAITWLLSLKFQKQNYLAKLALGFTITGLTLHAVGFLFRCLIAGRPPVSNMYESIIWVSLGCVVFGLLFEIIYKKKFIGLAATTMATIALIIGDSVPAVLDQSIKPLEPVLRSNYWLTIHVLTITLSYAAFLLAMGIGNIGLSYYARGIETKNREKLNQLALFVYRAMQVGVLLLTAGTILGGVWADYSWGRFWGWDPKETWALIADLGYLAILHGRFTGWLKTFGTMAGAVCAFTGVVMAWYGVNFVLGVGLHSYGFGGGGVHYVTAVVIAQLLYVGFAAFRHHHHVRLA